MIDPFMKPILARARANPAPQYETMDIREGRRTFEMLASYWNRTDVPLHSVRDLTIPSPAGGIDARYYIPQSGHEDGPIVVYFHGGGWTFGSLNTHDRAARLLAQNAGCRLLSVDYRLAPEHPFPAGHEDALTALSFVEAGGLGTPVSMSDVAVSGDSAGANIALGAMIGRIRAGLACPVTAALIYGCFAPDMDTPSYMRNGDGTYVLGRDRMGWYWQNFLGTDNFDTTTLAAPSRAPLAELARLPPLYMNAAALDPLLDDTLIFSQRLADVGIAHRFDLVPGVIHGFMQMSSELPAAVEAQRHIGQWLREKLKIA